MTGGSRTTFATGLAAYELGLDLQAQMKERAAAIWECEPAAVEVKDCVYRRNGQSLTFKELAAKISELGLDPVVGRASVSPEG
ncbi:MAG: molybdopterin cofactor-binding domain-containing protein, partial [Isosphaeraceae bacterium]